MAWYNASWPYRVKITTQNAKVDADLTGFPMYLDLSLLPAGFHTNVNQTDGRDIRMTTSDGSTEVPVEVVYYDSTTDTGEVHFKGNPLNASDVDFYLYYGNAAATMPAANSTYGKYNVWDSDYLVVLHGGSGASLNLADSTSYQRTVTGFNTPTSGAGKLGGGIYFAKASEEYAEITDHADFRSLTDLTIELWAYLVSSDTDGFWMFGKNVNNTTATDPYEDWAFFGASSGRDTLFRTASSPTAGWTDLAQAAGYVPLTTWTHLVASYDTVTMRNYKNGTVSGTTAATTRTTGVSTANPRIGTFIPGSYNYDFDGRMDEIRFSKIERSSTWLSTQYNNHSANNTFFSIGAQETNSTPGVLGNLTMIGNISVITL